LYALKVEELRHDISWAGHHRDPTIVLEAVTSEVLQHCFFGLSGSFNNTSVLKRSHIFSRLVNVDAPACNYIVNGHDYTMGVLSS
jgi:hypothetical protein